jgi:WD40 repeat protein
LENGTIIILSHVDLNLILSINAHSSYVVTMDNPKKGRLVSGSWNKTIKIWNHSTGTLINTLVGHTDGVYILKVLSNNDIASGSNDKTVRIWDSSTGLIKFNSTQQPIFLFDLSELSNNRIVSLDQNGTIKIWNYLNGSFISSIDTNFLQRSLAICKNGDYVVGSWNSGLIRLYDSITFNLKPRLLGHTDKVNKIIQLENDDLCSCSNDNRIIVWDWDTKKTKT